MTKPTGNPPGRPKGRKSRRTLASEKQLDEMRKSGAHPKDYIIGVLTGELEYDKDKAWAAETLMPYTCAKLQSIEFDGNLHMTHHEAALDELE